MKEKKRTLAEYYDSLPERTAPKTEFVTRVAERCNLKDATVRLWIKGKTRPSDENYEKILSEESGIPVNELFA